MKIFNKNLESEIVFIAEIGVNHEGSKELAIELIHKAAEAGADAVKFQSYTPERYASSSDKNRLERVKNFALSRDDHLELIAVSKKIGVHFFSTPLTEDWVAFLAENCEVIKIASGDLTFEPTLIAAAATNCKIILSTGLGNLNEIDNAIKIISEKSTKKNLASKLILLHCIAAYPTPIEEANILSIPFMKERYKLNVGFSNHIIGIEASLAAIANGASLIEMHFTDKKHNRSFHDHALSADPEDFKLLVDMGEKINLSLGKFEKTRQNSETPNLKTIRKGIVAAKNLERNTILVHNDIMFARPATNFGSKEVGNVIGKCLQNDKSFGESIKPSDLK